MKSKFANLALFLAAMSLMATASSTEQLNFQTTPDTDQLPGNQCTLQQSENGEYFCVQDPCPRTCQIIIDEFTNGVRIYSCEPCDANSTSSALTWLTVPPENDLSILRSQRQTIRD